MNGPGYAIFGLIIGFMIAALPGPIWLLCLKRTLSEGRTTGLVFGLGVTIADGIYGTAAAFGLTALTNLFLFHADWLQVIGGVFLCFFGVRIISVKPSQKTIQVTGRGLLGTFASAFLLTISNPLTILLYAGLLAGFGGGLPGGFEKPAGIVMGICFGSMLWWTILSYGAGIVEDSITTRGITWINRISGTFLLICGILTLFQILIF